MQSSIVTMGGETFITVVVPGDPKSPYAAGPDHPNFDSIMAAALADESDGIADLFDVGVAVARRFERLTERIAVVNGQITLDGDVVDTSLTKQVLRFLDEDVDDWQPLVLFFEKVQSNPDPVSRDQLYTWVEAQNITITEDGDLVCYKGVERDGDGGFRSVHSGANNVLVDGESVTGKVPNRIGAVVEMSRSLVDSDPHTACSTGLHVGSFDYAQGWARGATLEVHVNPRDFVSVPADGHGKKARVCRYFVMDVNDAPFSTAVVPAYESLDEDYDEDEGEYEDYEY